MNIPYCLSYGHVLAPGQQGSHALVMHCSEEVLGEKNAKLFEWEHTYWVLDAALCSGFFHFSQKVLGVGKHVKSICDCFDLCIELPKYGGAG